MKAMICPQCSANLTLDDSREFGFCNYCGAKIQINETIIHKAHINLEGVAGVNSLCRKGFMEIDAGEYALAESTFDKALSIDPSSILAIFGAFLTKEKNEHYYKLLKRNSVTISSVEASVINEFNCEHIAKMYCDFDDLERLTYVAHNFKSAITANLIDKTSFNNENIDMIQFLFDNGVDIKDIFLAYFSLAYRISVLQTMFSAFYLPEEYLVKMINLGLSLDTKVRFGQFFSISFDDDECRTRDVTISEFFKQSLLLSKKDGQSSIFNKYIFTYEPYAHYNDNFKKGVVNTHNLERYIAKVDACLPDDKKIIKPVKGCYVATCVYGSYDCPQVWILRRFRDETLDKTWYGRTFIKIYYAISPKIIKLFGETQWFKSFWKHRLDKMVAELKYKGVEDTPYKDRY